MNTMMMRHASAFIPTKLCLSCQALLAFGCNALHLKYSGQKIQKLHYSSRIHPDDFSTKSKVSFHDKSYWYPSIFSKDTLDSESSNSVTDQVINVGCKNQIKPISNLLVCGDGDLSYSASIANQLASLNVSLTATVLENNEKHNQGEK